MSKDKPDKLLLKTRLYQDRDELAKMLIETQELVYKKVLKEMYDKINSYIEICLKRNRF